MLGIVKLWKTCRYRIDVRLVSSKKDFINGHQNQAICHIKVFYNDLVRKIISKVTIKLNKLAYVGMCVLDLNKVLMYEFHYENKYGNKSRLLFTETDSLMFSFCQ